MFPMARVKEEIMTRIPANGLNHREKKRKKDIGKRKGSFFFFYHVDKDVWRDESRFNNKRILLRRETTDSSMK